MSVALWSLGIGFLVIVIAIKVNAHLTKEARKKWIYEKYGRTEVAEKIINKTIWVNETTEQLIDSLGKPVNIDETVLKTKRKEVWKYYQTGSNRFGLRVKVENGLIIGWEEKL